MIWAPNLVKITFLPIINNIVIPVKSIKGGYGKQHIRLQKVVQFVKWNKKFVTLKKMEVKEKEMLFIELIIKVVRFIFDVLLMYNIYNIIV